MQMGSKENGEDARKQLKGSCETLKSELEERLASVGRRRPLPCSGWLAVLEGILMRTRRIQLLTVPRLSFSSLNRIANA